MLDKADSYFQNEQYEQAIPIFEKLTDSNPLVVYNLSRCYYETGRLDQALTMLLKAIDFFQ